MTRDQLRVLASATLQALGIRDPSTQFVHDEMERQCVQLAAALPPATTAEEREASLRLAIARNPMDAAAWQLLAAHEQEEGRSDAVRDALQTVARLRPVAPEAPALPK